MIITLQRQQYLSDCTLGMLEVFGKKFFTIEGPHAPENPSARFISCVPEGTYRLMPYQSASGEKTLSLSNPVLDVYHSPFEVPRQKKHAARALVLIHAADYVHDVVGGSIGPGLSRQRQANGWLIASSRDAMNQIRTLVQNKFDLTLIIQSEPKTAAA